MWFSAFENLELAMNTFFVFHKFQYIKNQSWSCDVFFEQPNFFQTYSQKSVSRQRIGESASINFLLDKNNSVTSKYGMVLQIISWTIFNTSFQIQTHDLVEGKAIFATLIIIGVTFNVYLLIKVLSLMNIMNKPRMKYLEIFNQLDAYMRKRQFPIQLQNRLKFFFKKKFRRFYYEEDVIKKMLSGEMMLCFILKGN